MDEKNQRQLLLILLALLISRAGSLLRTQFDIFTVWRDALAVFLGGLLFGPQSFGRLAPSRLCGSIGQCAVSSCPWPQACLPLAQLVGRDALAVTLLRASPLMLSLLICILCFLSAYCELYIVLYYCLFCFTADCQPFIGVNYGEVADNLPPAASTASLLQGTTISKVRIYNVDPALIQSLAHTNISMVIGTSNADIASFSSSPSAASAWLAANFLPFTPATSISAISVGNEVLNSGDPSMYAQLLPAMQNLQSALGGNSGVKVTTVHSMAVLSQSDPPSSGAFHADLVQYLEPILGFLEQNGGPFMINPYPYFAYKDDPRPETLAFCLFQSNLGRLDTNSGITYMNMFDAQVDAVKSALKSVGHGGVEIVVAETGWPYKGDDGEVGATIENAQAYNGNLVKHLKSMVGTPLMPGHSVDTYIFALYDEDLKPGPTSERSFGLYQLDLTMIYDVGLAKSNSNQVPPPPPPPPAIRPVHLNPPPPMAMITPPVQPHQPVDCRLSQTGTNCNVPSSVGSQAKNFLGPTLAALSVQQLLRSIFYRTFGFFLSFMFHVSLPMLLLSL